MSFKTASQYVRDRLGIGFEVVDLRLDQALGEIKRGDSMLRLSTLQIFFGKMAARLSRSICKSPEGNPSKNVGVGVRWGHI
jgi:hypothetical protein